MFGAFRNAASQFIFYRTYARWLEDENRREDWDETVDRYLEFFDAKSKNKIPQKIRQQLEEHIRKMSVMPSMRALWAAGESLSRNNLTAYNCSFMPIKDLFGFSELLFILMNGVGGGFSVEKKYISQLPIVKVQTGNHRGTFIIDDSKEGWAEALKFGIEAWFNGEDVEFDYSKLRSRGARLLISGGRSSGPDPLKKLLDFARKLIIGDGNTSTGAQGRQLTSLECHDICCQIAEVVVVGGVRRSSLISLSDLNDELLRAAKNPPYPMIRAMSNNTAVFNSRPNSIEFLKEWYNLAQSGTGERGIFCRFNAIKQSSMRDECEDFGLNPCAEIILRPYQLCNLSEVVIRPSDTFDDLIQKIESAVWLGTFQASLTKFKFVRSEWKSNCEEEALLGVSLTGQLDNPKLLTPEKLEILQEYAVKTNKKAAKAIGINASVAICTCKPSGTVSQLVDSSSGMHPRRAPFYIRRYRISSTDPLFHMLKEQGVPFKPEVGQSTDNATTWVLEFPIKAPKNSIFVKDLSAIDQLKWYIKLKKHWCHHNASATVYVGEDEWASVGAFVYENLDDIIAVSFLPKDNGIYELAPEEEIDEKTYNKLIENFPDIDYSKLHLYEAEDNTTGSQTLACTGDRCELT
jgi:ribonucleoside-diphosphate reductase alpha chain